MFEEIPHILNHAIVITSFVFTMMLLIEYINVMTRGSWQNRLSKSKFGQYLLGILLGAIPGCLGAFTIVSLYTHGVVSFGTLVAAMIATSGDEAYVMLSLFPLHAILLTVLIAVIGLIVGYLTDIIIRKLNFSVKFELHGFEVHDEEACPCFSPKIIIEQLKSISFPRTLLLGILSVLLFLLLSGYTEPHTWNWIKITLLVVTLFAFFVVVTVPDHFLEEHLWKHVLKKHLLRIFIWTFGTLLAIHYLQTLLDVEAWIQTNIWIVLVIAVLIGMIPESGPHLIFVTLFAAGSMPFAILMASSIVQDGHGAIPLLAVSKKNFVYLKIVNAIAGLIVGTVGLFFI
ncbi:MAG: putative manganese transporter [Bacteroidota bacterium]